MAATIHPPFRSALMVALLLGVALPPSGLLAQQAGTQPVTAPQSASPANPPPPPASAAPGGYDAAQADEAATLMADQIQVTGTNQLVAQGNVVVYYKSNRLTAARVTYDKTTDQLQIDGPLRLVQPGDAGSVLVADSAHLSRDLQNGILIGARMVMARELQLAATQAVRKDGVTTTLTQVVASSCQVCASDPTPLWEIRAHSITHDLDTHLLHFNDAQFRVMGVPLLWTPYLRMPDPTVKRMSGVLRPQFRTTSKLGAGLEVPYFFPLGDSADLTMTPYLATKYTTTMGFTYRQAFENGNINITGATSRDSIVPGTRRGYIFADGAFQLADGYTLGMQLKMVSDPSYLLDYDITDDDRLWSGIWLEKVQSNQMIWMRVGNTHSIRAGESNQTQPMGSADFIWSRVIRPDDIGGEAVLTWENHIHRRSSDLAFDTLVDGEDVSDGRDTMRSTISADWRRQWLLPGGLVFAGLGRVQGDVVMVRQDDDWAGNYVRALPTTGVELRWPWVRTSGPSSDVIEPVAQLLWSPNHLKAIPDEDSLLTEFDEGNLFDFSRFPGGDEEELGTRLNLGVTWTRLEAAGWSLEMTGGRIIRLSDADQFALGSGLSGNESDWLLGTTITTNDGWTLANRALFDDRFEFAREELRLGYLQGPQQVAIGYIWMDENPAEGRDVPISEFMLESKIQIANGWSTKLATRYDFIAERAAKAAIGLEYANECVTVDLSLSRRFTSSSTVTPETSFGFAVQLAGFGSSATTTGTDTRVCRG